MSTTDYTPISCYTAEHESVTEAVVTAVSEATATPPLSLPTLYEVIDPDVLDRLFDGNGEIAIEFTYADTRVLVQDNDHIHVTLLYTPETDATGVDEPQSQSR